METYPNGTKKKERYRLTDSTYLEKRYDSLGSLTAEINYKDSVKNGLTRLYIGDTTYELEYRNGLENISWKVYDKTGRELASTTHIKLQAPESVVTGEPVRAYAKLVNSKADTILALFCCEIDKDGYPYSMCASPGEDVDFICNTFIPIL